MFFSREEVKVEDIGEKEKEICDPYLHSWLDLFRDESLDELLLNGLNGLWLVKKNLVEHSSSPFQDLDEMIIWLQEFAQEQGTRLDPLYPSNGGPLKIDGFPGFFRWHCLIPPASQDGPLFSLRRHRFESLKLADFAPPKLTNPLSEYFLAGESILICGATSSGKTSLLSSLLKEYSLKERVFILEALPEFPLLSPRWVRLTEKPPNVEGVGVIPMEKLVQETLRLRPDRLVVGEIRGSEARSFLELLFTGSGGVAATLHAGTPDQALFRLLSLARYPSFDDPSSFFVKNGITLSIAMMERNPPRLVQVSRLSNGSWKHIKVSSCTL